MGNVVFAAGDIFEGGMDVTVLPCSAKGTVKGGTARRLSEYGLATPKELGLNLQLGETSEPIPFTGSPNITKYIVFAASVFNDSSSPQDIERIAMLLGNLTNKYPEIRMIETPLLGTGAGGLSDEVSGSALYAGFKSSSRSDATLYVFLYGNDRLTKLTNNLRGINQSRRILNVFVSSKIVELKTERELIYKILPTLLQGLVGFRAWVYESDAPASNDTTRHIYLDALKSSALYIGIFWNEYGDWTIDEFEQATEWGLERLIFIKDVDTHLREPKLIEFLNRNSDVLTSPASKWFKTKEELTQAVESAIETWLMKRLSSDTNRRMEYHQLQKHQQFLWEVLREYNDYLVDFPDASKKDEQRHSRIIRKAIAVCLEAQDDVSVECEQCLKIDAGSRGFIRCSQKWEHNLTYIAIKRLTPHCVDETTPGHQQQAEVKRWGWYGNRNLNALQSAVERLQSLISERE